MMASGGSPNTALVPSAATSSDPPNKAETLAAEALEDDASGWIVFDPSESPEEPIDTFLQTNKPSVIQKSDGVAWICVRSPGYKERSDDENIDQLEEAWEAMNESGRPINFDTVLDLAKAHHCLSGKWLFYSTTGAKVNRAWASVARAVVSGQCGTCAKVSSKEVDSDGKGKHVICVYNNDFTDQDAVFHLENEIRKARIKSDMSYKPDAFTYMGIYRGNKWKLRPTVYFSKYDYAKKRSNVTPNYGSSLGR